MATSLGVGDRVRFTHGASRLESYPVEKQSDHNRFLPAVGRWPDFARDWRGIGRATS